MPENNTKMPELKIIKLCKFYEEAGKRLDIIDNLDAEFYRGDIIALLGKSGSGKTTLLNLISGIDRADSGEIWIGDNQITGFNEDELTLLRRNHLGIIFQFFNLIPTLNVLENVSLPGELDSSNSSKVRVRAEELLTRVGLGDRLHTYPDVLSGGEQQRVAIARALINNPKIILADEPTGNLDEDTAKDILVLLIDITHESDKTMIIATHSAEIVNYAHQVYTIHNGKLFSQ